jgi:hypothetical protein
MIHTFPDPNINAVVLGSRNLIITAEKRYTAKINDIILHIPPKLNIGFTIATFGLYSAFLACKAIVFKSKVVFKSTVPTTFLWFYP